jgi:hypothetical protein
VTLVMRRCLGCGGLGPWQRSGRCDECRRAAVNAREADPARAAHKAERYDADHRRRRRKWLKFILQGTVRCGRYYTGQCLHRSPIIRASEAWDLDHLEELNRQHPSHADCNRAARRNAGARR